MAQAFHTLSVVELLQGLQRKSWSSVALTKYFLDRIDRVNPDLHAVHFVYAEQALAEAKRFDTRRVAGEALPPLAGLPMTLKDAFALKGQRSTYGALPFAFHRPANDAACVASLKRAGVVIMGRTAVPTASFDWNCRNQLFPECRHPLVPEYSPGGSSGGAAAALVAGLTPLELGSDLGGSIRYPAHCCGVYGLRLSEGWVPFTDVGPHGRSGFQYFGVCGPLARHLGDLQPLLEWFARDFPDSRLKPVQSLDRPLRIAYTPELAGVQSDEVTQHALNQRMARWAEQGHQCVPAHPPLDFEALNHCFSQVVGIQYQDLLAFLPAALQRQALDTFLFKKVGPGWMRDGILRGLRQSQTDLLRLLARVRSVQNQMDRFFANYDLWVLPTSPGVTRLRQESGHMMQTHLGDMSYSDFVGSYLCGTSALGTPALALPVSQDTQGLPVGLQVHGPRFGDRQLLHLLLRLEQS